MHLVQQPGRLFEELVGELLQKIIGGEVKTGQWLTDASGVKLEVDVVFGDPTSLGVAEVKHYRHSSPPSVNLFVRALMQAKTIKVLTKAKRGLLVISCPLTPRLAAAANMFQQVEVWDSEKLFQYAAAYPSLLSKFEQLFEASAPASVATPTPLEIEDLEGGIKPAEGKHLLGRLRAIPPGREHATDFENASIDALKYLFDRDLHGWHEQHETEDGLHRRDLVCRILSSSEVWRLMLSDFCSRYVVFEFKNYSATITPSEVITTEKYLYPSALRKVAIIISPHGCSTSANKVIQGAMREHGKLIISLTVEEICKLLVGKDNGADPNTYLFERVDQFLMALGR